MINQANFESINPSIKLVHFSSMTASAFSMHEHFEIFFIQKGPVILTIDDHEITLHEGDIAFTPSFSLHKNGDSKDISADALVFSPSICGGSESLFYNRRLLRPYLRRQEISPLLFHLLSFVISQVSQKKSKSLIAGKSIILLDAQHSKSLVPYISALLAELSRILPTEASKTNNPAKIREVLQYCTLHFCDDISRDSVATDCGLSPNAVSQIFSSLNTSFPEYINNLRLNKAYNYLNITDMNVSQIMAQCGYINQGTFNRNFYKRFHSTPSEVRKTTSNNNIAAISEL